MIKKERGHLRKISPINNINPKMIEGIYSFCGLIAHND